MPMTRPITPELKFAPELREMRTQAADMTRAAPLPGLFGEAGNGLGAKRSKTCNERQKDKRSLECLMNGDMASHTECGLLINWF